MLWLLLFLASGEQLLLTNGASVVCDRFVKTGPHTVMVQHKGMAFVLQADDVDWQATRALSAEPARQAPEPAPRDPDAPLLIQKLDVTRTSIIDLIRFLADMRDINLYIDPSVQDRQVTYRLRNIHWSAAMRLICMNAGLAMELNGNLVSVQSP